MIFSRSVFCEQNKSIYGSTDKLWRYSVSNVQWFFQLHSKKAVEAFEYKTQPFLSENEYSHYLGQIHTTIFVQFTQTCTVYWCKCQPMQSLIPKHPNMNTYHQGCLFHATLHCKLWETPEYISWYLQFGNTICNIYFTATSNLNINTEMWQET